MKLLVLSDLHLAHLPFPAMHNGSRIDAQADVAVLAGDIDDGVVSLRWAATAKVSLLISMGGLPPLTLADRCWAPLPSRFTSDHWVPK